MEWLLVIGSAIFLTAAMLLLSRRTNNACDRDDPHSCGCSGPADCSDEQKKPAP